MELYHREETLQIVWTALRNAGLSPKQVNDAVNEMQNNGIYFREVKPEVNQISSSSNVDNMGRNPNQMVIPLVDVVSPHSISCPSDIHPHGRFCHVTCPTCAGTPNYLLEWMT